MRFTRFQHASVFPVEVEVLWGLHARPDALRLLNPPGLGVEILDTDTRMDEGSQLRVRVRHGVLRGRWTVLRTGIDANCGYTDVALEGPFPFWEHRHEFEVVGRGRAKLRDVIWYTLPGFLPHRVAAGVVNHSLHRLFAWRHARALEVLASPRRPRTSGAMRISSTPARLGPRLQ
jgi:ligand-binding SRPBCC domain-containing protein